MFKFDILLIVYYICTVVVSGILVLIFLCIADLHDFLHFTPVQGGVAEFAHSVLLTRQQYISAVTFDYEKPSKGV